MHVMTPGFNNRTADEAVTVKNPVSIVCKTTNKIEGNGVTFLKYYGAERINEYLLKTYVCRENQTFNVYWKEVEEAANYIVEIFKQANGQWYKLTTLDVGRLVHYVSVGGLVGDGFVFRVTAESRGGEVLARSGAVVIENHTIDGKE